MNLRVFHTHHVCMIWDFDFSGVWSMNKQGHGLILKHISGACVVFVSANAATNNNTSNQIITNFRYAPDPVQLCRDCCLALDHDHVRSKCVPHELHGPILFRSWH